MKILNEDQVRKVRMTYRIIGLLFVLITAVLAFYFIFVKGKPADPAPAESTALEWEAPAFSSVYPFGADL